MIDTWFEKLFSARNRGAAERVVIALASAGFLIHLTAYWVHEVASVPVPDGLQDLFVSPISAVYTPFSFVLVYEVLLLVYFIPMSFTESVARQLEIVSLIVLRGIFKDLGDLQLDGRELLDPSNLDLAADLVGVLLIFGLILTFKSVAGRSVSTGAPEELTRFVTWKKMVSLLLLPTILVVSILSLTGWITDIVQLEMGLTGTVRNLDQVFYVDFFTLLILVDVLLLLLSFAFTDSYEHLLRNSGFVVSTILIRLSFNAEGMMGTALIVSGVAFSVAILMLFQWGTRPTEQA